MVLTLKVYSLVSYCKGSHESKWIRLQVMRFFGNSLVLGYHLGINLKCLRTRDHVYFRLYLAAVCLLGISKLLRMKTA